MSELKEIIESLLTQYHNDWDLASDELARKLEEDIGLYEAYTKPMIKNFAKNKVDEVARLKRNDVWKKAGEEKKKPTTTQESAPQSKMQKGVSGEAFDKNIAGDIAVGIQNMMAYPLNKCKKSLGEATKDDLATEINMYTEKAKGHHEKAAFFKKVQERLRKSEKVEEKYTNEELNDLCSQIKTQIRNNWAGEFVAEESQEAS